MARAHQLFITWACTSPIASIALTAAACGASQGGAAREEMEGPTLATPPATPTRTAQAAHTPGSMRWAMLLACCIGLCAVTVPSRAMAQHPPASRAAPAPTPGTNWISVAWTASAGSTGITAYDTVSYDTVNYDTVSYDTVSYDVQVSDLSARGTAGANSPASGRPTISGKAQAGHTLTADTSDIADKDGLENATLTYQWLVIRGATEVDIAGAIETEYTVTGDDIGARIALTVRFSDDQGNRERLTSDPTSEIESAWPYEVLHPPFNVAQVWWWWRYNGDCTAALLEFETVTVDFTIHNDPNYSTGGGMFLMLLNGNISGKSFYFGLQTRLPHPLGRPAVKGTLFSLWDTRDQGNAAADPDHGWTYDGGYEGDFVSARRSYEWSAGDYRARVARDSSRESNADGVWYGLWFTDLDTNVETWIGSLRFPLVEGGTRIEGLFSTVLEIYGGAVRPADVPAWHVSVGIPTVNGVEAGCAKTRYPEVEAEDVTSEVRYDTDQRRMHLEAFGSTRRQTSQQLIFFPDRAGRVTLSSALPRVGETLGAGLHDSDGSADARWQWSRGATRTGAFSAISGATDSSYTPASSDVGMYLQVAVTYSDGHGPGKRAEAASSDPVRALVVNRPPAFPLPSVSFRLDHAAGPGVIVGTVGATDADGDRLTYSLSGPDAAFFAIDSDTGQIRTAAGVSFDAEVRSQYRVRVHVDDGQGGADTVDVVITVTARPTILPPIGRPVVRRSSGTGPFSIVENSGTDVGRFVATDPEGGGVTWSLATTGDHGRFEIDAANGALSFKEAPDFESDDLGIDEAYTVTVQATEVDGGNPLTGSLAVTVAVTDVNEPPTVTGNATPSVDENTTAVATYSATDPEEVPPSWSLQGGAGVFMITSAGALSFTTAPNYEVKSSYTVTVLASDGTNDDDHVVTVTVTDVDETEKLTLSARRPLIGADYTAAFEDGTGDDVTSPTWVWARSMSRSGSGTDITGATAATYRPVGDDRDNYLRVTVSYDDGHSDGHSAKTLQATSELPTLPDIPNNRPPTFPSPLFTGGATGLSVDENATAGTVVGVAPQATDPELGTLDYSLAVTGFTTDPPFEINATSRQIRVVRAVLNHEDQDSYSVTVTAEDEYNATGTATFDITIEDVNERPVVRRRSGAGAFSIVENSGTDVGRFVATDPEGGGVTWSLATTGDHGRFEIDAANGALSFKELPDYESSDLGLGPDKAYNVTVRATEVDDGEPLTLELTGRLDVTVTITNENEPPVVRRRSGAGPFSIVENSGTDVGRFVATDPEGGGVTWSLATSGDHGRFEIDAANGALSFKEAPDYERSDLGSDEAYTVTVRATEVDDGDPQTLELTGRLAVTVAVTNVNEPPTVTGNATPSVPENMTAVATYSATDPEEVPPSWSLQGGAGVFMITSVGALSFTTAPNYEVKSSYTVTVRASDGTNDDDHVVTVTVTDVDETEKLLLSARRPFIAIAYTAAFEEGTGDAVQSPMWAWERSPNGASSWDDITGATAATYRPVGADRDHYLRVTASYNDGHSAKTLQATSEFPTLPDSSTNRPPTFPSPLFTGGATGLSVDENATAGTVVGLAPQATDFEVGTLSYSLAVTGFTTDPPFEINATSRQIRVASGAALDHEDQDSYSVTVTAEDEYNATGTATFDITIEDVNERPVAVFDIPPATAEDTATTFAVLANDTDPDDGDTLTVSITSQPSRGRVVADTTTQMVTYTPAENDHGTYTFMYTASDGTLSSLPAQVTVTVNPVNDAPAFATEVTTRTVSENAQPGAKVGVPVTATDVDGDLLGYRIQGAPEFEIDEQTGQITVGDGVALDAARSPYIVNVMASDPDSAEATVEVTITVTAGPPIIITGGGGGGGGPSGPSPSEVDFEWTVKRDLEELDAANDWPTGLWSDGETLWIAENGQGADDEVYAYDRASGERLSEREFTLTEANRAPRGFWSDGETVWVSDSGRDRLFAYDLATGERLPDRDLVLAGRNADPRGIWSDDTTMWVLDGRADRLFAYALASGELLAEYALDSANSDPHGLWSDGVTVWVSDHGAKRLFAYRLPVLPDAETDSGEQDADGEARELERVRDEEFSKLSRASNNSPRGIWSNGDVMYVADESDDRVYSYNMPDAIDARLASLSLSGVDIGEFDPGRTDYEAVVADGVTETTVEAEAMQRRTDVAIDPPDADGDEANGHQVALQDLGEITVTVTSQDGSRKKVYRVQFPETAWDPIRDPWPHCLRGALSEGFSLVVYEGGSVEELVSCAESRGIVAFYALHDGAYVSYILGAPGFVNAGFLELFPDGLPPITPLIAGSNGPPSPDPFGDDFEDGGQHAWPECLRGDIAAGFSLVVYEGGSVEELEACAQSRDVAALYTLSEGEFVSYILGASEFVNQPFRDLFAGGLPLMTPLVARSEGPPGGR